MRPAGFAHLEETVGATAEGRDWLAALPGVVSALVRRWSLTLGPPFTHQATCSWVAPVRTASGGEAVLKVAYPHMEARQESDGLRFWAGDPTALLLDWDAGHEALLLERCRPGDHLARLPEEQQDDVIARSLRRLWRVPPAPHPFRPLSEMIDFWCRGIRADAPSWPEDGLVAEGLAALSELVGTAEDAVLLATDLHAGNVLAASRRDWLVIDPKPFFGDPCYDVTQHLLNCPQRMAARPRETVARLAGMLGLDPARVRHWAFARFAVRYGPGSADSAHIARQLSRASDGSRGGT